MLILNPYHPDATDFKNATELFVASLDCITIIKGGYFFISIICKDKHKFRILKIKKIKKVIANLI